MVGKKLSLYLLYMQQVKKCLDNNKKSILRLVDMVAREGLRLGTMIQDQFIPDFEIDMEKTPTYNPIEIVNIHVIKMLEDYVIIRNLF
jgi:hypothetical protein